MRSPAARFPRSSGRRRAAHSSRERRRRSGAEPRARARAGRRRRAIRSERWRTGRGVVRVAHLSPDAPNVDVALGTRTVLSNVPFGAVSDYLVLDPGTRRIRISPSGAPEMPVFDSHVAFENHAYTVAAVGEVAGRNQLFRVKRFVDDVEPPASDKASVTLIHAAPDAPEVDVTVEGADLTLFEGLGFGRASGYETVPAGSYTLEVRPATPTNDGDVVATFDVTLEGGTVVTAYAVGYLSQSGAPADEPFDLLSTVDSRAD
ncbi:MAG: DUF4397 domain-containing protein [Halarchaeum sp.]